MTSKAAAEGAGYRFMATFIGEASVHEQAHGAAHVVDAEILALLVGADVP